MSETILCLNAGSSNLKLAVFDCTQSRLEVLLRGKIDHPASAPRFSVMDAGGTLLIDDHWESRGFGALMEKAVSWVEMHLGERKLTAAGHRMVHGGRRYFRPEQTSKQLLMELERLIPLAPLHQPDNIAPIRTMASMRPQLPQVVCFDTAFHHAMPAPATRYALPREYESAGLRRYGFHGISYEYIAHRLRTIEPRIAARSVIVAHLGNGASLCAMRNGRSIDTTMGFTPLDGLVMGTRCGALDPGVVLYLQRHLGLSTDEIEDLLYRRSGLLGVSGGIASDMRTLLASDDPRARDAVELFVFHIVRQIGALASSLGGLDGLVFTAGIGEHAPAIRRMVCRQLSWLGVVLDESANEAGTQRISAPASEVEVFVIPTDEEIVIARHTVGTLGTAK